MADNDTQVADGVLAAAFEKEREMRESGFTTPDALVAIDAAIGFATKSCMGMIELGWFTEAKDVADAVRNLCLARRGYINWEK